ncbi:MAG: hypothetical protein C0595_10865 [Marinilabiliales bacterium]|nr:MAG: hypothetical protein C0595_10865 [Marinilabiliales bacterium]
MKDKFDDLTKAEQVIQILKFGEKIDQRISKDYDINLFQIDNCFAEIWYHHNTNSIVKAKIVDNESVLNNYPKMIGLPEIN